MDKTLYNQILRRKSFHVFPLKYEKINEKELDLIYAVYKKCKPLIPNIRTEIRIVPAKSISFKTRQEYNILFYSEKKEGYLENIGYLGQQLDLYLVSKNIGTLWFGLARCDHKQYQGLDYCIMIAIAKIDSSYFRKDLSQFNRKILSKYWEGAEIGGITKLIQTAPSSVNSQPWKVHFDKNQISVSRIYNPILAYFNKIDIGIFLYYMELCLLHENIEYSVTYFLSDLNVAVYDLNFKPNR